MARQRTITRTITRNKVEITMVDMNDLQVKQFNDILPQEIDTVTKYENRLQKFSNNSHIKIIDLKIIETIEEKYEMLEDKFIELATKVE